MSLCTQPHPPRCSLSWAQALGDRRQPLLTRHRRPTLRHGCIKPPSLPPLLPWDSARSCRPHPTLPSTASWWEGGCVCALEIEQVPRQKQRSRGSTQSPLANDVCQVLMFTASSGQSHWLVGSGTDQAFTLLQQGFVDHGSATLAKPLRTALNEVLVFARIVDPRSAAAQAAAGATGIQSLPRKLTVTNNQLFFQPAAEVSARESDHLRFTGIQLQGNGTWDIAAPFSPNRYHVRLSVTLAKADAGVAGGIRLLKSANQSEHTTVKVAFNGTDPCSTGNVKFHPGMDMPGNDISGTPVSGADANPEACFKSCCSNRDCVAFVYVTSQPGSGQPYCWLKRTVGGTHPLAVANYGIVRTGSAEYTLDTTQSTLDTTVSTGKFVGPDVLDVTKPTVLDVYVDGPVVEVYGPGGAVVLSALVFPTLPTQPGITLFSEGGGASFDVDIWSLEGDAS
eukprot:m.300001 g.300001  ORF g.300001 m.300001 type:complete len:451 (+) comp19552_c0_seq6:542-1894(+)